MTLRATVDRLVDDAASDGYTGSQEQKWTRLHDGLACWVWESTRLTLNTKVAPAQYVTASELMMMAPKGTDLVAGDRISTVSDRLGGIEWDTPMDVDSIHNRHSYVEAKLVRVGSRSS